MGKENVWEGDCPTAEGSYKEGFKVFTPILYYVFRLFKFLTTCVNYWGSKFFLLITILKSSQSHHQVTLHLVTIQHRHWNWSDWFCHGQTILSQSWDIIVRSTLCGLVPRLNCCSKIWQGTYISTRMCSEGTWTATSLAHNTTKGVFCETRSEPPPSPASLAVGSTPRTKRMRLLTLLDVRNAISPYLRFAVRIE